MRILKEITRCESNGVLGLMLNFDLGQPIHITQGILDAIQSGDTPNVPNWFRELDWASQEQIMNLPLI